MDLIALQKCIVLMFSFLYCCVLCANSELQNEIKDPDTLKWPNKEENILKYPLFPSEVSSEDENRTTSREQLGSKTGNHSPEDNIEFRESKSQSSTNPNVYFTKVQTKEHVAIHYPNVPSNPNNRLQLDPEDAATLASVIATTSKPSESTSTNFNFFTDIGDLDKLSQAYNNSRNELIKSMEITLDIVKHSFWGDQNVIFSPLSLINILALLMLGAQGRTFNELASVLRLEPVDSTKALKFHQSYQKLRGYLSHKTGKDISIEMANQIFADKYFPLDNAYVKESLEFYDTPVKSFNFGSDGKYFQDQVNQWVRVKTKGKIQSIIDKAPSIDTSMALVNAVHFKGNWEIPFVEKITRSAPFYVKPNETIDVEMMTNVLTIPYFENNDYQMIAIPYKGNQTGFFACLPKASNGIEGLKQLEKRLSILQPKDLEVRVRQMMLKKVAVKIPKMKIDTDGHMEEILTNMGIPSMFHPQWANFSKISQNDGLFVSAVHHRAMIEVNERGTEAAAVTLAAGDRIIEDPPIPFIANKPFMFFIYHIKAKCILFWGRVTRPGWT